MSPDPVVPGLFLPCSLPRLLSAAAGGGLEPSPARRFRGASPHRLLSYAKEPSVAGSFAHGALRIKISGQTALAAQQFGILSVSRTLCCPIGELRWSLSEV